MTQVYINKDTNVFEIKEACHVIVCHGKELTDEEYAHLETLDIKSFSSYCKQDNKVLRFPKVRYIHVPIIGNYTFDQCPNLESVMCDKHVSNMSKIVYCSHGLMELCTSADIYMFKCPNLQELIQQYK